MMKAVRGFGKSRRKKKKSGEGEKSGCQRGYGSFERRFSHFPAVSFSVSSGRVPTSEQWKAQRKTSNHGKSQGELGCDRRVKTSHPDEKIIRWLFYLLQLL
ncbi:hypothetical protein CEXT_161051 [Caerostris extrusa]|uniref:Uncharacterized protein n=1 Tax=Caerostris extrusa TaxID=172846 RepID=A0AAV4W6E3_CAEEX|nr:hypothetical protein CEXT_161051 [Caerostris extrusa]